jgi:phosphinothricin acetyltransferase
MVAKFRIATPDDAPGVLAIYAPYCESTHLSFEIVAPSEAAMRERISGTLRQYPWIIAEAGNELVGYVYASQHRERAAYRWAVDVAAYVAPACRRQGLAGALYECLFEVLRAQGYFRAYAAIALPNEPSVAFHEAMGFRAAGHFAQAGFKLGRWIDVGWWQRDLQPEAVVPAEPSAFPMLSESEIVARALEESCRNLGVEKYNPE